MMGEEIKQEWIEVIDYIKRSKGATFAELENRFGWLGGGDYAIELTDQNLLLWTGLSQAGIEFYSDRRVKDQIEAGSCHWLLYADDGKVLKMPIAKRVPRGGYKKQRWAPVAFQEKKRWSHLPPTFTEGE
tara:strand:+ start:41 stop:430 length:390 start_codon:yes stop_codon:yes gene_type:complete